LDVLFSEQVVGWRHIVTQWWLVALLSNVIDVESWCDWVTKDNLSEDLAEFKSNWPDTCLDQTLASCEGTFKDKVLSLTDELVLLGESVILWILKIWVNETISNSHTLEVHLEVVFVLEDQVVGDSWDVVTGIRLTSDIEIFSLELWVLLEELNQELGHVVTNLIFVSNEMEWVSMGETGSNWLIDVDQVGILVPGVWIRLESLSIFVEFIWTVFVEKSNLGSTSWSTGEPKDNWVVFGIIPGLEPPEEHIVSSVVTVIDVNESGIPGLSDERSCIFD
jgi:hypothetical protein